ncbi:MAG: hypothetical protein M1816_000527 [Peltula sp. TS41687]|nr:MAG: hypothetical protein M1816_000527 [Peltula sp. TS41687]
MVREPGFNPFHALGVDPHDPSLLPIDLHVRSNRRTMRHVFGDRPGTHNITFPTEVDLNVARDYFRELEAQPGEFEAARKRWADLHRSSWNPGAPKGSEAVHLPDPSHLCTRRSNAPAHHVVTVRTVVHGRVASGEGRDEAVAPADDQQAEPVDDDVDGQRPAHSRQSNVGKLTDADQPCSGAGVASAAPVADDPWNMAHHSGEKDPQG